MVGLVKLLKTTCKDHPSDICVVFPNYKFIFTNKAVERLMPALVVFTELLLMLVDFFVKYRR